MSPVAVDGKVGVEGEIHLYNSFWERLEKIAQDSLEGKEALGWNHEKTFKLDEARIDEKISGFPEDGDCIVVLSLDGSAEIKLNRPTNDPFDLEVVSRIRHSFEDLYLTNTAQAGKTLELLIGKGDYGMEETIPQIDLSGLIRNDYLAQITDPSKLADNLIRAAKIATHAVEASKIAQNAITETKIAPDSINTPHLKANIVTGAKIAAETITGNLIASNIIATRHLIAAAITADKINTNAVTADKILALAVTTEKLAALSVTAGKIAASTITADKINTNAVTADKILALAVTTEKLAALSVTAGKIAASTITADKYAELRNTYVFSDQDSLDASYPLEMLFEIIPEMTAIQSVALSFKIRNYRAYATGVPSGGGHTTPSGGGHTTPGGGGHTTPAGGGDWVSNQGTPSGGGMTSTSTTHDHSGSTASGGVHDHGMFFTEWNTGSTEGHQHTYWHAGNYTQECYSHQHNLNITSDGAHQHYSPDHTHPSHSHWVDDHTHAVSDHTHIVSNHQHAVSNHTHSLTFGIYEDPQSPTINVFVDNGEGYGDSIGEYTEDQLDIDLTEYIDGTGFKQIKFESDKRTRLAAHVLVKVDLTA